MLSVPVSGPAPGGLVPRTRRATYESGTKSNATVRPGTNVNAPANRGPAGAASPVSASIV
jgi:hypothetical protein